MLFKCPLSSFLHIPLDLPMHILCMFPLSPLGSPVKFILSIPLSGSVFSRRKFLPSRRKIIDLRHKKNHLVDSLDLSAAPFLHPLHSSVWTFSCSVSHPFTAQFSLTGVLSPLLFASLGKLVPSLTLIREKGFCYLSLFPIRFHLLTPPSTPHM